MRKSVTFGRQPAPEPKRPASPDSDSQSDRDILITHAQYQAWKQAEREAKLLKARLKELEREKSEADQRVRGLEDRLRLDSGHIEELTFRNGKLESELRDVLAFKSSGHSDSMMEEMRRENGRLREELSRIQDRSIESGGDYEVTLTRMRDQTRLIRERLQTLESAGRSVEEHQGRIDLLEAEKGMLNEHIQTLQMTLSEQCQVIEHLKAIIASLVDKNSSSPYSKHNDSLVSSQSLRSPAESPVVRPRDIVREIETLDGEIEALQTSLAKVLED
jgi:chromosome segregation ATPase